MNWFRCGLIRTEIIQKLWSLKTFVTAQKSSSIVYSLCLLPCICPCLRSELWAPQYYFPMACTRLHVCSPSVIRNLWGLRLLFSEQCEHFSCWIFRENSLRGPRSVQVRIHTYTHGIDIMAEKHTAILWDWDDEFRHGDIGTYASYQYNEYQLFSRTRRLSGRNCYLRVEFEWPEAICFLGSTHDMV